MSSLITWLTHFTANDYYHAAAFCLTGAASVYTVQFVKIVKNNTLGKTVLRSLNFVFNALYTGAAAVATGGVSLGSNTKTVLALSAFSAGYYRFHNSILFKKFEAVTTDALEVPTSQFAENA